MGMWKSQIEDEWTSYREDAVPLHLVGGHWLGYMYSPDEPQYQPSLICQGEVPEHVYNLTDLAPFIVEACAALGVGAGFIGVVEISELVALATRAPKPPVPSSLLAGTAFTVASLSASELVEVTRHAFPWMLAIGPGSNDDCCQGLCEILYGSGTSERLHAVMGWGVDNDAMVVWTHGDSEAVVDRVVAAAFQRLRAHHS
jgi:hypothetical protein